MKHLQIILVSFWIGNNFLYSQTPTIITDNYDLFWEDNFNGTELDTSKWNLVPEWQRQGGQSGGGCKWDDDMVSLSGDGFLKVGFGFDSLGIISGGIRSYGLFETQYGYFEIKAQFPKLHGWGAFWLMNPNVGNIDDSGVDGTEIDVVESPYFSGDIVTQTLHWDGYGVDHMSNFNWVQGNQFNTDFYSSFNTYGVQWEPEGYTFYVNGVETWNTQGGGVTTAESYLKITTETAAWLSGTISQNDLPANMVVDYVKVFKKRTTTVSTEINTNDNFYVYKIDNKHIGLSHRVDWSILNLFGNIINKGNGNTIDFFGYPSGMYFIKTKYGVNKVIQ